MLPIPIRIPFPFPIPIPTPMRFPNPNPSRSEMRSHIAQQPRRTEAPPLHPLSLQSLSIDTVYLRFCLFSSEYFEGENEDGRRLSSSSAQHAWEEEALAEVVAVLESVCVAAADVTPCDCTIATVEDGAQQGFAVFSGDAGEVLEAATWEGEGGASLEVYKEEEDAAVAEEEEEDDMEGETEEGGGEGDANMATRLETREMEGGKGGERGATLTPTPPPSADTDDES